MLEKLKRHPLAVGSDGKSNFMGHGVGWQGEHAASAREHVQCQVDHGLGFQFDVGLQPSTFLQGRPIAAGTALGIRQLVVGSAIAAPPCICKKMALGLIAKAHA